jgi:hypothetical protein
MDLRALSLLLVFVYLALGQDVSNLPACGVSEDLSFLPTDRKHLASIIPNERR